MADDSLVTALSGLSGFSAGLRDVLVPQMQARYNAGLQAEKEKRDLESAKALKGYEQSIKPRPRILGVDDSGEVKYDKTGDPGQDLSVKEIKKPKIGTHIVLDSNGAVISKIPATEGSGDTVTKIGEDSADKLATKKASMLPKAKTALNGVNQNIDKEVALIDEVLKDPSLGTVTGPYASRSGTFTAGQARVRASLDQIKAQAFLGSFQALKQSSPNGSSGMGALSDTEGARLEKAVVNLDAKQATPDFVKRLGKYRTELLQSKQNFQQGFDDEFGSIQPKNTVNARPKIQIPGAAAQAAPARQSLPSGANLSVGEHVDAQGNKIEVFPDGTYEDR